MSKPRTTIFIVLPIVVCLSAVLFTYLALLGENDRISNVVRDFFTSIQQHNYPQTLEYLSRDLRTAIGTDEEHFYETCFLLELSLLKEYDVLDENTYRIEFQKDYLWIPYLQDTTIPIGVSLQRNKPKDLAEFLGRGDQKIFVDKLFTVVREDGSWKIKHIDHADSSLAETFTNLKEVVKLDQYIQKTPNGFRVSPFTVRTEGMTPIETRRLSFMIHKVLRYLGEDTVNKSDDQSLPLY